MRGAAAAEYLPTLELLGDVYNRDRDYPRAIQCHQEALDIWLTMEEPTSINSINALNGLAHVRMYGGQVDEAIRIRREVLDLLNSMPEERPGQRYAATLGLGVALNLDGQANEAEAIFRSILALPGRASDFWTSYYLAELLVNRGDSAEALSMLERMMPAMRAARDVEPRRLGHALIMYSAALEQIGDFSGAETAARESVEVLSEIDAAMLPAALRQLASSLHRLGRNEGALEAIDRALLPVRTAQQSRSDEAISLGLKALILADLGAVEEARALAERAVAMMRAQASPNEVTLAKALMTLADVEMAAKRPEAALAALEEAMTLLVAWRDPVHQQRLKCEETLALALIETGRFDEASHHIETMIGARSQIFGSEDERTRQALELRERLNARLAEAGG
jgi:tetratricopeptide (TPR) repeat protein